MSKNVDGNTFYVDFERIKKHGGYVYFWILSDYLKPDKYGDLSFKRYNQGDCKLFRVKPLSYVFHKQPMGRDREPLPGRCRSANRGFEDERKDAPSRGMECGYASRVSKISVETF